MDFETSIEWSKYGSAEADDFSGNPGCSTGSTRSSTVAVGGAHIMAAGEDMAKIGVSLDSGAGRGQRPETLEGVHALQATLIRQKGGLLLAEDWILRTEKILDTLRVEMMTIGLDWLPIHSRVRQINGGVKKGDNGLNWNYLGRLQDFVL